MYNDTDVIQKHVVVEVLKKKVRGFEQNNCLVQGLDGIGSWHMSSNKIYIFK